MKHKKNKTTGKPIPHKLKVLVREAIKRHRRNCGGDDYHGEIMYMDYEKEGASKVAAEIKIDPRYLTSTLMIYPWFIKCWERDGDEFAEHAIAHEMAHFATERMKDLIYAPIKSEDEIKEAWESLTERIARFSLAVERKKK